MGKYKRSKSQKSIRPLVRTELMKGTSPMDIAKMFNLKLGEVKQAIDYLKKNDTIVKIHNKYNNNIEEVVESAEENTTLTSSIDVSNIQVNNLPEKSEPEKEETAVEEKQRKRTIFTKEILDMIYDMCIVKGMSRKKVAENLGINYYSVCKKVKEMVDQKVHNIYPSTVTENVDNNHQYTIDELIDNTSAEKEEEAIEEAKVIETPKVEVQEVKKIDELLNIYYDDKMYTEYDDSLSYITVGLINNRHNMGVDKFIFEDIPNEDIFNFAKLERTVKDFIYSNIKFVNNVPDKGLIVRATGLQSAIMTVTKICYDLKINLIISHHQITSTAKFFYRQQPIFTDFPMYNDSPYSLSYISSDSDKTMLYNSSIDDYKNINKFYVLKTIIKPAECRFAKKNGIDITEVPPIKQISIVTKDLNDALLVNMGMAKDFSIDREYYKAVFLKEIYKDITSPLGYNYNILQRSYY